MAAAEGELVCNSGMCGMRFGMTCKPDRQNGGRFLLGVTDAPAPKAHVNVDDDDTKT